MGLPLFKDSKVAKSKILPQTIHTTLTEATQTADISL